MSFRFFSRRRRYSATISLMLVPAGLAVAAYRHKRPFSLPSKPASAAAPAKAANWDPIDPQILYDGSRVAARDLTYLENVGSRALPQAGATRNERAERIMETLRVIGHAKSTAPQASMFTARAVGNHLELTPADWSAAVAEKSRVSCDIGVVGAELGSLSTAMEAADRGRKVALVYVPPLGGIAADTCANQRYYDCMPGTPHPSVQRKLFHDGLGMANWFGIPEDVDRRLATYLRREYGSRIRLVPTRAYDSLHVEKADRRIGSLLTEEGVRVTAADYIDSDPESRVAEKAGIPYDVNTPHLSYGLVFDVRGFRGADYLALRAHQRITPAALMARCGVTEREVQADARARGSLALLRKQLGHDAVHGEGRCWFGFRALAQAYDFWMNCRGLHDHSAGLRWLNERRVVSGFNLCQLGSTGTFNSISYRIRKNLLQYSHRLDSGTEFAAVREVEQPGLSAFFRYVTGNSSLTARVPPQFYVRKSTAFFQTSHPYTADEFRRPTNGRLFMLYGMDLRDLHERDPEGWEVVRGYLREARGKHEWTLRPSTTETEIPNLFLLNKCGVTPAYSGGLRIEQNQISTGALLVDELTKRPSPVLAAARR